MFAMVALDAVHVAKISVHVKKSVIVAILNKTYILRVYPTQNRYSSKYSL